MTDWQPIETAPKDGTIPEDVRKIAEAEALKYVEWLTPKPAEYGQAAFVLSQSFVRIIMAQRAAERERCAKVAEAHDYASGTSIAYIIRDGHP